MLGHAPNLYWKIMWRAVSPLLLICLLIYYIIDYILGGAPTYQAWDKETVSWTLLFFATSLVSPPPSLHPIIVKRPPPPPLLRWFGPLISPICSFLRARPLPWATRSTVSSLSGCCWCRRSAAFPPPPSTPSTRRSSETRSRRDPPSPRRLLSSTLRRS